MIKREKDSEQSEKFIEKARELDCDEDESVFDQAIKKIAKAKPKKKSLASQSSK